MAQRLRVKGHSIDSCMWPVYNHLRKMCMRWSVRQLRIVVAIWPYELLSSQPVLHTTVYRGKIVLLETRHSI